MDEAGRVFATPKAYADEPKLHAALSHLRANAPVSWVEVPSYEPFWAITKHADIMDIERANNVFTNYPRPVLVTAEDDERQAAVGVRTLIHMDDPQHRGVRAIGADWFRPKAMRALRNRADELAKVYVDKMAAIGPECDFAQQVAVNYPLYMIMSLLGVPESDFALMLKLTQELFGSDDDEFKRGADGGDQMSALLEMFEYFTALIASRRETQRRTWLRRSPTPPSMASRCPTSTPSPTTRSSPPPGTTPPARPSRAACWHSSRIPTSIEGWPLIWT
jgi:cytochrome P450